jgi:isopentenyl diphosphate isomerase/L-lactate dehydrogenase-like FMN-dependent dehydrogenase
MTTESAVDLAGIVRLADFEPLAHAALDTASYDYIAGGASDEITLADNVAAWSRHRFRPRVLVDVSAVDVSTTLLGSPVALPVAIAPMATHGLTHPDAELASARAAAAVGVPFILSTMASRSIEDVARAAPDGVRWFQLYAQREESRSRSLVERAAEAGYRAIVLTVDLPVLAFRDRDRRSGFELPALGNFAEHLPTHRPIGPAGDATDAADTAAEAAPVTRTLTWADLATIRSWSPLPIVLKGILTVEDARLAIEHGVDGIVVSNHGGRQLDRVQATAEILPGISAAVAGRTEVWVDGGIRRGLDIAVALALGARGVLVGRPMLWALAVGGQAGVEHGLRLLRDELENTLALLGVTATSDLRADHLV